MKINRAGNNYRHAAGFLINRPQGSGDYLLLIIKTAAFMELYGKRMEIPQGSALIFKKGTPQLYGATTDKYVNDFVHFALDEGEESVFAELDIPFDTPIPIGDTAELSAFIRSIAFERYSQNVHKAATMRHYFELILLKLSERMQSSSPEQLHPYYGHFLNLRSEIQLEPQNDWSIDLICKKLLLSRSYVQHLYKLFFGVSIVRDVCRGRMERAKYLLSSTEMTVTAVSRSCGYENDVHFMRLFKKETGRTPSEYRAERSTRTY